MKTNPAPKKGTAAPDTPGGSLWWVVTCMAAAAVGIAVARPAAELVREPLSPVFGGMPTVALFGALFGGCIGLGQALVRRGRSGPHPAWWMVASSVSGAVGYLVGTNLATALTDPIRGKVLVYVSEALGYLVLGAVLGLLVGVAQGGLRRASGQGMWGGWIALSMLGWALGFVVAAGVGLLITSLPSVTVRDLLFGALTGLTAGSLEALAVARRSGV
jgi:hypothetical protein